MSRSSCRLIGARQGDCRRRLRNQRLLFGVRLFRGLCPHPRETAFLDFRIPTKLSLDWRTEQGDYRRKLRILRKPHASASFFYLSLSFENSLNANINASKACFYVSVFFVGSAHTREKQRFSTSVLRLSCRLGGERQGDCRRRLRVARKKAQSKIAFVSPRN